MVNGIAMPINARARIVRPQRCETCGSCGYADNPNGPPRDCRVDGLSLMLLPTPNGAQLTSLFKPTEPHWWCAKWTPLIQQAASVTEGTDHVSAV